MSSALVLTGGGARAAYQAGVVKALFEILPKEENPFSIISGASAGAINGVYLAANVLSTRQSSQSLCTLWQNLTWDQVIDVSALGYLKLGGLLLKDMGLGGLLRRVSATHLLDTSPLRRLLSEKIEFAKIREHIKKGALHAVSLTATNYNTGTSISFFEGSAAIKDWTRTGRMSLRQAIGADHVMASSAIPLLFPPQKIDKTFYCDGLVRLRSPLSPAIHTGAKRIFAVGIRRSRSIDEVRDLNRKKMNAVNIADIAGTLLNATFLDALDSDVERLERINRTVGENCQSPDGLIEIPIFTIQPSLDLGELATSEFQRFPTFLRHLLGGLGADTGSGLELISYLSFDSHYTRKLVDLGYKDMLKRKDECEDFFRGSQVQNGR